MRQSERKQESPVYTEHCAVVLVPTTCLPAPADLKSTAGTEATSRFRHGCCAFAVGSRAPFA